MTLIFRIKNWEKILILFLDTITSTTLCACNNMLKTACMVNLANEKQ
jgi:hypothetical protein